MHKVYREKSAMETWTRNFTKIKTLLHYYTITLCIILWILGNCLKVTYPRSTDEGLPLFVCNKSLKKEAFEAAGNYLDKGELWT